MISKKMQERIENDFSFHPFGGNQRERAKSILENIKNLALLICDHTPESREQSLAITSLDNAYSYAVQAIVRHEEEV